MDVVNEAAEEAYEMHSALLSKGFALERPPSVNEAIGPAGHGAAANAAAGMLNNADHGGIPFR